jgi:hypothetical protein
VMLLSTLLLGSIRLKTKAKRQQHNEEKSTKVTRIWGKYGINVDRHENLCFLVGRQL